MRDVVVGFSPNCSSLPGGRQGSGYADLQIPHFTKNNVVERKVASYTHLKQPLHL
jgi:hypothetical protein